MVITQCNNYFAPHLEGNNTNRLKAVKIGDIIRGELDNDTELKYIDNQSNMTLFPCKYASP